MSVFQDEARLLLIEARKILDSEDHWTQGAYARTVDGSMCMTYERKAVAFCSDGALGASYRRVFKAPGVWDRMDAIGEARRLLMAAADVNPTRDPGNTVTLWNDNRNRTHAEVIAAFDKAIAELPAPESA